MCSIELFIFKINCLCEVRHYLFQFLTYTLKNCLLSFMVFVFGSVTICYGLAPGLVVPIATQQGRWLMWWGAGFGVLRRG